MPRRQKAIKVFISYAHEDESLLRQLETHLILLKRQGIISTWYDREIVPGTNWAKEIDRRLSQASIILLLVSADFLASDYCYQVEMKRALERHEAGKARVLPILVRPVDWQDAPFSYLYALPTDARPITTWSNRDKAFVDIVSGIRRAIEDLSLLPASSSRAALPPVWNLPYPHNPFFTGRDDLLVKLHTQLQTGQTTALSQSPHAISGLGGIGKTQIAIEYAYRYHQDYEVVLWARAESEETLITSYATIATLLSLPECEEKDVEVIKQAVKTWLQTHQKWLLILDNTDDLDILPPFLPPAPGGHILITTRAWEMQRLATRFEVEVLSDIQGAELLLRRAGLLTASMELAQASIEDRHFAILLTQELGGLPLALDQAGAYLEATGMSVQEYQELYRTHQQQLLSERRSRIPDHPEAVATTWSLSFTRMREKNPAAADLLCFCAFLAPDAIPEEILTAGGMVLGPPLAPLASDAFGRNQAIEVLRSYSLVRRDSREKTLSVHRLVQSMLQDTMQEQERRTWAERGMLAINVVFPDPEHGTWSRCERFLTQALIITQWIEHYHFTGEEAVSLLLKVGRYLQDRARYRAKPFYQRALHICDESLGPDHPDVVTSLNNLAILYYEQGEYAEAEALYQRELRIREQHLGPDHPDVATSLNNLAILYYEQGKYSEAEPFYRRALDICEASLGPEHPDVGISFHNLAECYSKQGKYAEAEALYQRELRIWEQHLGPDHSLVASALNNLASLYRKRGKYAEAEALYQRELRIQKRPGQVASVLNDLASLYREQGKYGEAEPLYQRALHIQKQRLGPNHPDVAYPLNNLASLYRTQGKYGEAEPLYQRALWLREQSLGPDHPETAESMHDYAQVCEAQDNGEEARIWYARALAIREKALGPNHPKTMQTRQCLITLLHAMGQHEKAARLEATQSEP